MAKLKLFSSRKRETHVTDTHAAPTTGRGVPKTPAAVATYREPGLGQRPALHVDVRFASNADLRAFRFPAWADRAEIERLEAGNEAARAAFRAGLPDFWRAHVGTVLPTALP